MKHSKTNRGFGLVEFKDRDGNDCNIQISSLATEDCVWMGFKKVEAVVLDLGIGRWVNYPIHPDVQLNNRMQLNGTQCKQIIKVLQTFVETGELEGAEPPDYKDRLYAGRHYLMGVQPEDLTVEDALEAFGFTRDGLNDAN